MGAGIAKATDPRTVALNLQGRDVVEALSRIEVLPVDPDNGAKVVIDEASGDHLHGRECGHFHRGHRAGT